MMNLNDTISAFRCCTQIPPMCKECPLTEMCKWNLSKDRCKNEVKLSVNHWLTKQEPRVMTREEYEAWTDLPFTERDPVFHEGRTKRGTVTCWVNTMVCSVYEYGNNDRCWTSRPTEEQRKATPWDAQEQRDYEAAVEMAEYCERYEPTFNAEDGSM